jgi:glutamate synthase domain-containing protein 3
MLRPQVFALVDGEVQLGLIASEKQAIDAALSSISSEFPSVPAYADSYWNARGGSHTDGGAFIFSLHPEEQPKNGFRLICTNKFGTPVTAPSDDWDWKEDIALSEILPAKPKSNTFGKDLVTRRDPRAAFELLLDKLKDLSGAELNNLFSYIVQQSAKSDTAMDEAVEFFTKVIDSRYASGKFRRSRLMQKANEALAKTLRSTQRLDGNEPSLYSLVDQDNKDKIRAAHSPYAKLVIDCRGFPMEGEAGVSFLIKSARDLGWNRVVLIDAHGQRFIGAGLGPRSKGLRIDVYGSPGDYLGSGLDGAEVVVHANGQDQLGQILSNGRLVVYGDVGQTFLYGAKGGDAYVLGNAAGRPLINAVGRPRVVINGTCLDYLAESFMAGNPLFGGGFVVLNGMTFDPKGRPMILPSPYPGGNLFSLASGGAIYIRDPKKQVGEDQLNGGRISRLTEADWKLIYPHLKENERLFGIPVEDFLLKVDGVSKPPEEVYRKIEAAPTVTLAGAQQQLPDTGS